MGVQTPRGLQHGLQALQELAPLLGRAVSQPGLKGGHQLVQACETRPPRLAQLCSSALMCVALRQGLQLCQHGRVPRS